MAARALSSGTHPLPLPKYFPLWGGEGSARGLCSGPPAPGGRAGERRGLRDPHTHRRVRSAPHPVEGQLRAPADQGRAPQVQLRGALQAAGWHQSPQDAPPTPAWVLGGLPCTRAPPNPRAAPLSCKAPPSLWGTGLPGRTREGAGPAGLGDRGSIKRFISPAAPGLPHSLCGGTTSHRGGSWHRPP